MSRTRISVAPILDKRSMTVAICFFSTIELTASHPFSSRDVMVGARLPGVTSVASFSSDRSTLYWHRTYFWAVMTPRIRDAIRSTMSEFLGALDLIRIASDSTTVSMAFKPAALIVSPDSAGSKKRVSVARYSHTVP